MVDKVFVGGCFALVKLIFSQCSLAYLCHNSQECLASIWQGLEKGSSVGPICRKAHLEQNYLDLWRMGFLDF
jgi:hypothetical protein